MNIKETIKISASIKASIERIWNLYTAPEHIVKWNNASDDWHTTKSVNDLRSGGKFSSRMEAKDGSYGFDFSGVYTSVDPLKFIAYRLDDNRMVEITFREGNKETYMEIDFEAERENSIELQQKGWQSILNNFKKYVEK